MTTFVYTAFDSKGKLFQGNVQEKSWTQALRRVKEMGLFPTCVKEKPQRAFREVVTLKLRRKRVAADRANTARDTKVPAKALVAFTRQLATLLEAGIPLVRALRSIQQQEENRNLQATVADLVLDIEGGATFSDALRKHPKMFNRLYLNLVIAGETAGMLESALARLADFLERSGRIRGRMRAALAYPILVVFFALGMLALLTLFVIPRFTAVFAELNGGKGLPAFTEFVIDCSTFAQKHWLLVLASGCAAAIGFKLTKATARGRAAFDRVKLRLPVIGRVARKAAIARLTRTLGTMLQNGVPLLQALTIARETANNVVLARAINQAHQRIEAGDTLTAPLQTCGLFPSTVISMIDVGEQSGALPDMLLKVADNYDEEVDNSVAAALSLLEPALIIFLAIIVGGVVIALFLPIIGFDPNPEGAGSV